MALAQALPQTICLPNGLGIRPPLKWAGGKRWLVPTLKKIWDPISDRRFVEPFSGGLAPALGLLPERALLNDINPHAINFYKSMKTGLKISIEMKNDEESFYRARERFNSLIAAGSCNTKEAAELFYYLNRTGFNGLCRFNKHGEFNVPFGRYTTIQYRRDFEPYRSTFKKWAFKSVDFERLSVKTNDFVYADPPYDVDFTQYSRDGFTWEDQIRLAEWLVKLQCPVVASNQATVRVINLYRKLGFKITLLSAPRLISCTGDRSKAQEMLATIGI